MANHPNRGRLTALLRRRIASAYPVAAPFDNRDVVICFPTPEDADAFSKELAFEPEGQQTITDRQRIENFAEWVCDSETEADDG